MWIGEEFITTETLRHGERGEEKILTTGVRGTRGGNANGEMEFLVGVASVGVDLEFEISKSE